MLTGNRTGEDAIRDGLNIALSAFNLVLELIKTDNKNETLKEKIDAAIKLTMEAEAEIK